MGLFGGKKDQAGGLPQTGGMGYSLYMKQKVFSIRDKYSIYSADQQPVYEVVGKITGLEFDVFERGAKCMAIKKKLVSIMPEYKIEIGGTKVGTLRKKMKLLKVQFEGEYNGQPLAFVGDFAAYDFAVMIGGAEIGRIHKQVLSWGDTYAIDIFNPSFAQAMVATVIIIDNALHDGN